MKSQLNIELFFPLFRYKLDLLDLNSEDKEDLFQECCITLLKAWKRYNKNSNAAFSTFLFKYLNGTIIDWQRRNKRGLTGIIRKAYPEMEPLQDLFASPQLDIDSWIDTKKALGKMDIGFQTAIYRALRGKTLAQRYNKTRGHSSRLWKQGLKKYEGYLSK